MSDLEQVISIWTDEGWHVVSQDVCKDGEPIGGLILREFRTDREAVEFAIAEAERTGLALSTR